MAATDSIDFRETDWDDAQSEVVRVPDDAPAGVAPGARRPTDLLSREQLDALSERSDLVGLTYLGGHFAAIGCTGWLLWLTTPGWWMWPALLLHGVVISYLFSPVHECSHYTAFRTRWLNEAAFWLFCTIYIVAPNWFRYFHLSHHRFTMIRGKDPEIIMLFERRRDWIRYVSAFEFWWRNIWRILRHATLGPDPADVRGAMHVPKHKHRKLAVEARILLSIYTIVIVAAIVADVGWWLLWLWIVPRLIGEPVQRALRVAEHTGCEETPYILRNTRTTLTSASLRLLGWQMPFHVEHHLYPNVPFHALPKLHRLLADELINLEIQGYLRGHARILKSLTGH